MTLSDLEGRDAMGQVFSGRSQ